MKNTNLYNLFIENRLVGQKPGGEAEANRAFLDSIIGGGSGEAPKDPTQTAKNKAEQEMARRQKEADEAARKNSVEKSTELVMNYINRVQTEKMKLDKMVRANPNPVAMRVAIGTLLDGADRIGCQGTGAHEIRRSNVMQASDLAAITDAMFTNFFYNRFGRIDIHALLDSGSQENWNRLEEHVKNTINRASFDGEGSAGRQKAMDYSNDLGSLINRITRAQMEFQK